MPAILEVKKRFQCHRFVLLTNRQTDDGKNRVSSWDVLGPIGWFDEVIVYAPGGTVREMAKNGLSLARTIRKLSPEHIFNLSPKRSRWQAFRDFFYFRHLASHKASYYGPPWRSFLFSAPHPEGEPCRTDRCEPEWKTLLRIAGGREPDSGFRLAVPECKREGFQRLAAVKGILARRGEKEKRLLAIGPGSRMPAKKWPVKNFCELGKLLLRKFPQLHLLVLGASEDEETGRELCQAWGERACNLAGKLSIYGSAAALERCAGFIGNDSGTMHLAAMVGTPCVALFSARDRPGKWAPYGDNHIILRHATQCAGCMLEECVTHRGLCLSMITVAQVLEAAQKILTGTNPEKTGPYLINATH